MEKNKEFALRIIENQEYLLDKFPAYWDCDEMMYAQDAIHDFLIENNILTEDFINDANTGTVEDLYYDIKTELKTK